MQEDILSSLKNVSFLSNLSDEELKAFASNIKIYSFPKHALIITEGDEIQHLILLLSGKVRLHVSNNNGHEFTLQTQEPGSYFGEILITNNQSAYTSVVTMKESTCGIVSKDIFLSFLKIHPDATYSLMQDQCKKIMSLTKNVKNLALLNVYERFVEVLYEMAVEKDGVLIIPEPLTFAEFASLCGSSWEMMSKMMKELVKGGYIEINDKNLKIIKNLPLEW